MLGGDEGSSYDHSPVMVDLHKVGVEEIQSTEADVKSIFLVSISFSTSAAIIPVSISK